MKYLRKFIAFLAFLLVIKTAAHSQKFFTDDVENFWKAYDTCRNKNFAEATKLFDSLYIKKASSCLQEILVSQKLQAKDYAGMIGGEKDYFSKCRKASIDINKYFNEINLHYSSFKTLYPKADIGDVYFMFTAFYTGGQARTKGIVIGMDYWSRPKHDSIKFNDKLMNELVRGIEAMPVTVIHEQVHRNQDVRKRNTLLGRCLSEGGADFIAFLVTGKINNEALHKYGNMNELKLKEIFKRDIDSNNFENWLYNSFKPERPRDLGYYIGFKICESYYNISKNKQAAVSEILRIKNSEKFLEKSGYLNH